MERGVAGSATLSPSQIQARVQALGEWFHNIDLNGVRTAPDHFLGDYPAFKWRIRPRDPR